MSAVYISPDAVGSDLKVCGRLLFGSFVPDGDGLGDIREELLTQLPYCICVEAVFEAVVVQVSSEDSWNWSLSASIRYVPISL